MISATKEEVSCFLANLINLYTKVAKSGSGSQEGEKSLFKILTCCQQRQGDAFSPCGFLSIDILLNFDESSK